MEDTEFRRGWAQLGLLLKTYGASKPLTKITELGPIKLFLFKKLFFRVLMLTVATFAAVNVTIEDAVAGANAVTIDIIVA